MKISGEKRGIWAGKGYSGQVRSVFSAVFEVLVAIAAVAFHEDALGDIRAVVRTIALR